MVATIVMMKFILLPIVLGATQVYAGLVPRAATTAHTSFQTKADNPMQTGIASNCNKFYDVVQGDNCGTVETAFGISHANFLKWNVSYFNLD